MVFPPHLSSGSRRVAQALAARHFVTPARHCWSELRKRASRKAVKVGPTRSLNANYPRHNRSNNPLGKSALRVLARDPLLWCIKTFLVLLGAAPVPPGPRQFCLEFRRLGVFAVEISCFFGPRSYLGLMPKAIKLLLPD